MPTISRIVLSKAGADYYRNDIPIGSIGIVFVQDQVQSAGAGDGRKAITCC